MKFRLSVTVLEDRANPSGLDGAMAPPSPYDPGSTPAQTQPIPPAPPATPGSPTPTIPPTGYPG